MCAWFLFFILRLLLNIFHTSRADKRAIATAEIIQDAFNIQKREKTEIFLLLHPFAVFTILKLFNIATITMRDTEVNKIGESHKKNENENVLHIKLCKSFFTQLFNRHGVKFSLVHFRAWFHILLPTLHDEKGWKLFSIVNNWIMNFYTWGFHE